MYLSKITGNILNKFNNQTINILYQPQRNSFDLILSECGFNLFIGKAYKYTQTRHSKIRQVTEEESDLFNYNVGISNNIIGYSGQKIFSALHLNSLIFTHSYRPKQVKKEDLVLINDNLSKEKKIFPTTKIANNWDLISGKIVVPYGIPTEKFYIDNEVKRSDRVLLLNFENQPSMENFAKILSDNGLEVDIITEFNCNIDLVRELFNRYKVVVDINDHNISNLLCASACGCQTITYMTEMITSNYSDLPNLFLAKSIKDIIDKCKYCLNEKTISSKEYIENNFPFEPFKNKIIDMINEANREVFIL